MTEPMTDQERISLLEAQLEALRGLVVELVDRFNIHDHKFQVANDDPFNPFRSYSETEWPTKTIEVPVAVRGE